MENLTPDEILEEINKRQERFKYLRYLSWVFALIFFLLIVDIFFFEWRLAREPELIGLQNYGDFINPVNIILFFAYVWGNLYFIYDFLTDKMEKLSNTPFMNKVAFLGWNVVCLGNLLGFINV